MDILAGERMLDQNLEMLLSSLDPDNEVEIISDKVRVQKLSQDFNWFSPLLKNKLGSMSADVVLRPKTMVGLLQVLSQCALFRVSITVRGAGTGNYGQSVPLEGGILLDLSSLNRILDISKESITAEAGVRIASLEASAAQYGSEIRMFPSTFRSATIGGFICGGSGGIGSFLYGGLSEPNNILSATICTLDKNPVLKKLQGSELSGVLHAYGTSAVVVDVTVPLERGRDWYEMLIGFEDIEDGLHACDMLSAMFTKNIRLLTFIEAELSSHIGLLNIDSPVDRLHCVIAIVEYDKYEQIESKVELYRGTILDSRYHNDVKNKGKTYVEFTWNHTTLHTLKKLPHYTYLQTSYGNIDEYRRKVLKTKEIYGFNLLVHLEYVRRNGEMWVIGLPVINFQSAPEIYSCISTHRENKIQVADPHTFQIENIDNAVDPNIYALKQIADPHSLLNPGKLPGADHAC